MRVTGAAALFSVAENAGTIASSSGSANVVPMPLRNVRRGKAILVTIMTAASHQEGTTRIIFTREPIVQSGG